MNDLALLAYVWQRTARAAAYDRIVHDERGEGVISAAIAADALPCSYANRRRPLLPHLEGR